MAFYFGWARCRLLVLQRAPSVLPWWLQIKDTQSKTHSLHQRARAYYVSCLLCVCLHICWRVRKQSWWVTPVAACWAQLPTDKWLQGPSLFAEPRCIFPGEPPLTNTPVWKLSRPTTRAPLILNMSLTCLKLLKFKQWKLSNDEQDGAAVPARVWRLSLVILLPQQTNMFEAQAAIARQAPRAISNVQRNIDIPGF